MGQKSPAGPGEGLPRSLASGSLVIALACQPAYRAAAARAFPHLRSLQRGLGGREHGRNGGDLGALRVARGAQPVVRRLVGAGAQPVWAPPGRRAVGGHLPDGAVGQPGLRGSHVRARTLRSRADQSVTCAAAGHRSTVSLRTERRRCAQPDLDGRSRSVRGGAPRFLGESALVRAVIAIRQIIVQVVRFFL